VTFSGVVGAGRLHQHLHPSEILRQGVRQPDEHMCSASAANKSPLCGNRAGKCWCHPVPGEKQLVLEAGPWMDCTSAHVYCCSEQSESAFHRVAIKCVFFIDACCPPTAYGMCHLMLQHLTTWHRPLSQTQVSTIHTRCGSMHKPLQLHSSLSVR
jgi:hypothetical protein